MAQFPKNFRKAFGQVYAGGVPDEAFLTFFKNTLGGRVVISLDGNVAKNIDPIVKKLGMAHIIIPISSGETTLTDPVKSLVRQIRSNLIDNAQPVYIHCFHGSDRTGLALALYRVMKQNWNCDSAISEEVRWGYGNGISTAVQSLWKSLICSKGNDTQASIDDDIVENMRDNFEAGNVAPAFVPQQSWAPDIGRADKQDARLGDSKTRRRNLRRKLLSDINDDSIPMIGQHDNYGSMGGAGVVENSGILQLI